MKRVSVMERARIVGSLLAAVGCACVMTGCAHQRLLPTVVHVMGASGMPHVSLVNVGGALDERAFVDAAMETRQIVRVNMAAKTLAAERQPELLQRAATLTEDEPLAALTVYIVNTPDGYDLLACPRRWAVINVRALGLDVEDDDTRQQRTTRVVMKGVGLACGLGGNPDPRCVMYYQSFSAGGIDATSASYGPYAHFPLTDILSSLADGKLIPPHE